MVVIRSMKILLSMIVLLFLLPLDTQAKDLKDEYAVFGVGGKTCKSFSRAIELGGRPYKEYESWLFGYFSAYNQYTPNTYNILGARRMDQIITWLETQCKQYPNQFFVTAAAILLRNMYETRRNFSPK